MTPQHYILQGQSIVVNISPMGFHRYARHYLETARAAPPFEGFSPVRYYLYCHSLELALKAFLLAKGSSKTRLKELGHDLARTLAEADSLDLVDIVQLSPKQREEVKGANEYYRKKDFEYFTVGRAATAYKGLPDLAVLDELASSLLERTDCLCREA